MKVYGNTSYNCFLQDVNEITELDIPELFFHLTDENGLTGILAVNDYVTLVIDLLNEDKLQLMFEDVYCFDEGNYTIKVNNIISDVVTLRLIGMLLL